MQSSTWSSVVPFEGVELLGAVGFQLRRGHGRDL